MVQTPIRVFTEVKKLIMNFIWDDKPSKIRYDVLIQPVNKGGLGLIDLETKCKSLCLNWINRYLNNDGSWQAIPNNWKRNLGNIHWKEYFCYNLPIGS